MSIPGSGSVYSVTIKPSTRSARSIAVTSVLNLWRPGGRREPPIWLRPTAALGDRRLRQTEQPVPHLRCTGDIITDIPSRHDQQDTAIPTETRNNLCEYQRRARVMDWL